MSTTALPDMWFTVIIAARAIHSSLVTTGHPQLSPIHTAQLQDSLIKLEMSGVGDKMECGDHKEII